MQTIDPQQKFHDLTGVDQEGMDAIFTVLNDMIMMGSDGQFDPDGIVRHPCPVSGRGVQPEQTNGLAKAP